MAPTGDWSTSRKIRWASLSITLKVLEFKKQELLSLLSSDNFSFLFGTRFLVIHKTHLNFERDSGAAAKMTTKIISKFGQSKLSQLDDCCRCCCLIRIRIRVPVQAKPIGYLPSDFQISERFLPDPISFLSNISRPPKNALSFGFELSSSAISSSGDELNLVENSSD